MRDILHCDLNNFYASCECLANPELKGKAVAVGGSVEDRHGVIVASNYKAKSFGIKCGVTVYQALKLCPDVVICTPNFKLYNEMSQKVRKIYADYTDQVEVFSIDECWLDVTHSKMFGSPIEIANKIRERVKAEIGLTISVGVSFNKTFAKIGSDLKKPDATTEITVDNYKDIVWRLPVNDMFGVGRQTKLKLFKLGVNTIGDLAKFSKEVLIKQFGKVGEMLYNNSNGLDEEPVAYLDDSQQPKSVGNSTTFYKDLTKRKDIELGFTVIAESVVSRMIKHDLKCAKTLSIVVKDTQLNVYQKQCQLNPPCRDTNIYTQTAIKLFYDNFKYLTGVRLLGITVGDWCDELSQVSMFDSAKPKKCMDSVVVKIRDKFGIGAIKKGNTLLDNKIAQTFVNEHLDKND
ncbi:MAG: DNA polymerase IV [Clostridia bacterium]|nr:DNA polymerase IV [Clostridia bacterium]